VGFVSETWVKPSAFHILILAAAGLMMMLGHMFTFLAYRNASAQAVAPFYYAFMIWAVAMGYLLFGDIPNTLSMSGMVLILTSGLGIIYLEKVTSKKSSTAAG
jgi:drug/metabolite transporter (DMT)-like permease